MANNSTVDRPHAADVKNLLETAGYDLDDRPVALDAHHDTEAIAPLFVDDEEIDDRDDLMRWLARNAH